MNILINNLIAKMYGSNFLLFYGSAIGIILSFVLFLLRDRTASQPIPEIPAHPNPYIIAYLRDKEEVLTLAGFSLVQKGYLEVQGKTLHQVFNPPNTSYLNALEKSVFDFFGEAKPIKQMFCEPSLQSQYLIYQQTLENEQLLRKPSDIALVQKVKIIAALSIIGLGFYHLTVALSEEYQNVEFLISMAFLAVLILFNICENASQRITAKGQNYLQQLQIDLKKRCFSQFDENTRFLVALFGINLLAGTIYQNYFQAATWVRLLSHKTNFRGSSDRCNTISSLKVG